MDFALDEEQALIAQTVRRFVEKDVRAWAADADRARAAPPRLAAVAGAIRVRGPGAHVLLDEAPDRLRDERLLLVECEVHASSITRGPRGMKAEFALLALPPCESALFRL
ncbi:MAG: hypothetical protein K8M05_17765, partial [Deltaproteobacteria bacterium]|nr:hypothetical protein [Kofleriaceae bacterium]